jgi:hypothetical protein
MSRAMQAPLLALLALAVLSAATAQADSDRIGTDLRRCAQQVDDQQRLACFDALVKALPQISADQFGMNGAIERKRDPATAAAVAKDRARESLAGTITNVARGPRGEHVFTLDNGQQWIEVEPRPGLEFSAGEHVTIEHGALGTLWLKAEGRRQVKVRRIQ